MNRSPSYQWALRCIGALAIGGNIGAAIYFSEDAFGVQVSQSLLTAALVLFLVVAIYSLFKMYLALAHDPALSPSERSRYRRNILLVGPVAAAELVLTLRSSKDQE